MVCNSNRSIAAAATSQCVGQLGQLGPEVGVLQLGGRMRRQGREQQKCLEQCDPDIINEDDSQSDDSKRRLDFGGNDTRYRYPSPPPSPMSSFSATTSEIGPMYFDDSSQSSQYERTSGPSALSRTGGEIVRVQLEDTSSYDWNVYVRILRQCMEIFAGCSSKDCNRKYKNTIDSQNCENCDDKYTIQHCEKCEELIKRLNVIQQVQFKECSQDFRKVVDDQFKLSEESKALVYLYSQEKVVLQSLAQRKQVLMKHSDRKLDDYSDLSDGCRETFDGCSETLNGCTKHSDDRQNSVLLFYYSKPREFVIETLENLVQAFQE